ncbi:MAG TPA: patatin-like phospholipase family protein [Candidatus Dormibacteraeota bacterium]|nr:patatin-like phospholipase family protein [Candidatus Dormibacteraeota bacterium]
MSWPAWLIKPRLAVVLGGGATAGAFEVGVIDVLARRGIVPDLLVGTSIGAVNAAFWALNPDSDAGERLLELWLGSNRSIMFPDGPLPMVGRLLQRKGHLTTQQGLDRLLRRSLPETATIESCKVPLAIVAADADHGRRVVLRTGRLIPAVLASSAIPGLWPPMEVAGQRLVDGGVVANCDVEAAVEAGMTDVLVVDVMGDGLHRPAMDVGEVLERSIAALARRQTELGVLAFGRAARIAVLRPILAFRPRFGDFSLTRPLFNAGQEATDAFLARHLGPRGSVRPGWFEYSNAPAQPQPGPLVSAATLPA